MFQHSEKRIQFEQYLPNVIKTAATMEWCSRVRRLFWYVNKFYFRFNSICESSKLVSFLCLSPIAGSSIRDDCLYSTSTQKQSFDSMTLSQCQPTKTPCDMNSLGPLSKQNTNPFFCGLNNTSSGTVHNRTNQEVACSSYEDDDAKFNEFQEIHISINCSNKTKLKNESKLTRFIQAIFRWRLHSRNIGYYSPRANHSNDMINVRLSPVVVVTNDDVVHRNDRLCNHDFSDFMHSPSDQQIDMDSISNSSAKDDNTATIKDELSTYMEELREREFR